MVLFGALEMNYVNVFFISLCQSILCNNERTQNSCWDKMKCILRSSLSCDVSFEILVRNKFHSERQFQLYKSELNDLQYSANRNNCCYFFLPMIVHILYAQLARVYWHAYIQWERHVLSSTLILFAYSFVNGEGKTHTIERNQRVLRLNYSFN